MQGSRQFAGAIVESFRGKKDNTPTGRPVFKQLTVATDDDPLLGRRLAQQIAVGGAVDGNHRVISGSSQPAPQPSKHLVAQKLHRLVPNHPIRYMMVIVRPSNDHRDA
ncbi:MAG: hypothetical protein RBS99_15310 [Rhodospirillales bacterium]|nr:hypothetical protein [Rhodospirillales bacterium]